MFKTLIIIPSIILTGFLGTSFINSHSDTLKQEVVEQFTPSIKKQSSIDGVPIPDEIWSAVPDTFLE